MSHATTFYPTLALLQRPQPRAPPRTAPPLGLRICSRYPELSTPLFYLMGHTESQEACSVFPRGNEYPAQPQSLSPVKSPLSPAYLSAHLSSLVGDLEATHPLSWSPPRSKDHVQKTVCCHSVAPACPASSLFPAGVWGPKRWRRSAVGTTHAGYCSVGICPAPEPGQGRSPGRSSQPKGRGCAVGGPACRVQGIAGLLHGLLPVWGGRQAGGVRRAGQWLRPSRAGGRPRPWASFCLEMSQSQARQLVEFLQP